MNTKRPLQLRSNRQSQKYNQNTSQQNIERNERFAANEQTQTYFKLKVLREKQRQDYIIQGKIPDPNSSHQLSKAIQFVGECMDMCPEFERYERELQMGLDPLEKVIGTDQVDHQRAVKRFRRSAAGDEDALPCDVRPPSVLVKTLDYLFHDILQTHGLESSYSFVRDRARAIRKDFFVQNYRGMEAVFCHERIARYHIMCSHELCENPNVSLQQEHEQMRKTLQSLREYYADLSKEGIHCPNEAEFQAYYLASHLFQNEFVSKAESLRPELFTHPLVQLTLEFHALVQRNNEFSRGHPRTEGCLNGFSRFFRCIRDPKVPYLLACVLHMSFVSIRRGAIKAMQKAYYCFPDQSNTLFTLSEICDLLGLDTLEQTRELLEYYEIPIQNEMVCIGKMKDPLTNRPQNASFSGFVFELAHCLESQTVSFLPRRSQTIVAEKRKHLTMIDIVDGASVAAPMSMTTLSIPVPIRPLSAIKASPISPVAKPLPPPPVKKVVDEQLANDIYAKIMDEIVNYHITQCYHGFNIEKCQKELALMERKRKETEQALCWAIDQCSQEVYQELIQDFIQKTVFDAYYLHKNIQNLNEVLLYMSNDILKEAVQQVSYLVLLDVDAELKRELWLKRRTFKQWKQRKENQVEAMKRKQAKAVRYLLNTASIAAAPPMSNISSFLWTPQLNGSLLSNFESISKAAADRKKRLWQPLDLLGLIDTPSTNQIFKLCASEHESSRPLAQSCSLWLAHKLGLSNEEMSDYNGIKSIIKRWRHLRNNNEVILQWLSFSAKAILQKYNYESVSSGTDALVYQFVIESNLETAPWADIVNGLYQILKCQSIGTKCPLLLIVWMPKQIQLEATDIFHYIQASQIISLGPVSEIQLLPLWTQEPALFDTADQVLTDHLQWLYQHARPPPSFSSFIFSDYFIHAYNYFCFQSRKTSELYEQIVPLDQLMKFLSESFNEMIQTLQQAIQDHAEIYAKIGYPCSETSRWPGSALKCPMEWNSPSYFQSLILGLESFLIPIGNLDLNLLSQFLIQWTMSLNIPDHEAKQDLQELAHLLEDDRLPIELIIQLFARIALRSTERFFTSHPLYYLPQFCEATVEQYKKHCKSNLDRFLLQSEKRSVSLETPERKKTKTEDFIEQEEPADNSVEEELESLRQLMFHTQSLLEIQ